jgi:hypothetical protein
MNALHHTEYKIYTVFSTYFYYKTKNKGFFLKKRALYVLHIYLCCFLSQTK